MAVEGPPTATTNPVSSISGTTATLNGLVNPQNLLTAVSFCYGTNANFSNCTQVVSPQSPLAAGTSNASVSASIQGLTPGTTYYVRVDASNNAGSTLGNALSFTTPAPPAVTTRAASNLSQTGTAGTLNALVNPAASQTTVSFCYSKSPTLVGCTSVPGNPSSLSSSTQPTAVSADISGLSTNTVYYFVAVATNSVGTTYGSTEYFTTPTGTVAAPVITGISPGSIGDISGASITITGTGFSTVGAGAQVTIGGISATVTSRSATQLVVTSPAGTVGATNVVVNNVDGQSTSTNTRLSFISSAPTNVSGTIANAQSQVTWTATSFTGPAVSNYLVQYSSNGGVSWTNASRSVSTSTSTLVTGLINGSGYIFRVAAINSVGAGTFSSNSPEVIPQTLPGQPTELSGTAGNGQAALNWVAPSDNGGRNIITYKVEYSSNGGANWTEYPHPDSSPSSLVVSGLNNGTSYIFRVAAVNSVGTGTYSPNSATVNLVAPLALSFGSSPVGVVLGEAAGTHSVTAATSPLNTGQTVFASTTPLVCTVNASSGALTILSLGTCTITANNAGTANYSAAPTQTQNIPVSSGSLAGLNLADLEFLTSASILGATSYTLNASSADTQLTLTIPSGALPSGTLVKIYLNKNLTTAAQFITSSGYLLNFVVGWMNTNDGSLPIATTPLVINAVNADIKKGMVGYGILNGVPTPLGTATSDGSITMYMTEDPLLVVAPTTPDAPTGVQATSGRNQSSVVSWTVPISDGGEQITSYKVTASQGGGTCTVNGATATSCTMSNLQNGTNYTFTVQAENQVGFSEASSASASVTPAGAPTFNAPSTGLSGTQGSPYTLQLSATGASNGSGNVAISSYALTSGTLPAGLSLNSSSGRISGTPAATGSFAVTVTATDANSQTAAATFTLNISAAPQSTISAIVPAFSTPIRSVSGFSVTVTNYDPSYVLTAAVNRGSITNSIPIGSNWLLTVTGLTPGQSATITVEASRVGYVTQSSVVTSSALDAVIQTPVVSPPSSGGSSVTYRSVTFDSNGGTGTMSVVSNHIPSELPANTFVKLGFVFTAWNTKADGTGIAFTDKGLYAFVSDVTLYAQWLPVVSEPSSGSPQVTYRSVTFDANGGAGKMTTASNYTSSALPANTFVKLGFIFTGWNTKANGTGLAFADKGIFTFASDVTLYAQWASVKPVAKLKRLISTFAGDKSVLTSKMRATIAAWVKKLPKGSAITCRGSTSGKKVTAFDKRLASARAKNVCVEAVRKRPDLKYFIQLNPSSSTKASARHVWIIQN